MDQGGAEERRGLAGLLASDRQLGSDSTCLVSRLTGHVELGNLRSNLEIEFLGEQLWMVDLAGNSIAIQSNWETRFTEAKR